MTDASGLRLWATLTAVAGVATLGVVVWFQSLPEVKAALEVCEKKDALLWFEVARTQADLDAVFGPIDGPCRPKLITAMDAVNTIDVWAFIPAYTAFVSFAAMFLSGGVLRPFAWAAIAFAFLALGTDYVETMNLLAYTPELAPAPERLIESGTAAWVKFFALGINGLLLAALCFTAPHRRRILGALLCLPIIGVTLMFIDMRLAAAQTFGFLLSWTPLMIMAIKSAVTGRP